MSTPLPYLIHPINEVVAQIDQGEEPWVCLNSFLHDWWCYAIDARQDLISEPHLPAHTAEGKRWAAFCVATVEEVCRRISFPRPSWIDHPEYMLEKPWYDFPDLFQEDDDLLTTPEPFRRRNIFIDGSVLGNKYELRDFLGSTKPRWEMWSDEELRRLHAKGTDVSSPHLP
jgi:hypothetical protein